MPFLNSRHCCFSEAHKTFCSSIFALWCLGWVGGYTSCWTLHRDDSNMNASTVISWLTLPSSQEGPIWQHLFRGSAGVHCFGVGGWGGRWGLRRPSIWFPVILLLLEHSFLNLKPSLALFFIQHNLSMIYLVKFTSKPHLKIAVSWACCQHAVMVFYLVMVKLAGIFFYLTTNSKLTILSCVLMKMLRLFLVFIQRLQAQAFIFTKKWKNIFMTVINEHNI